MPVPSINVIQHKNHTSDGKVELDARKGKRDFVQSGLEKCGFEDSGLLLGRRIPLWQKDNNGVCLHFRQLADNTDCVIHQPLVLN